MRPAVCRLPRSLGKERPRCGAGRGSRRLQPQRGREVPCWLPPGRCGVPALTSVTRGWDRVICSPVHLAPRLITLFSAAADKAKEQSTVRFLAALRKVGRGNITDYVAGTKRPALHFSHHLGKSRAARWRHYWQRPGVWLSGRPEQHPRPCLRSRPGAAAAPVLWSCRPGRAAGKAAGTPHARDASLSH